MQLTTHFRLEEFACHSGEPTPKELFPNILILAQQLEVIREAGGGKPLVIKSGYRSPGYNAKVGGKAKSQHLLGKAADISIEGITPGHLAMILETLIGKKLIKEGGIGVYDTFVHYDTRGTIARWHEWSAGGDNRVDGSYQNC